MHNWVEKRNEFMDQFIIKKSKLTLCQYSIKSNKFLSFRDPTDRPAAFFFVE